MEKKRRERINNCLEELKNIVLNAINEEARPNKLEKADILEMTVRYLHSVQPILQRNQKFNTSVNKSNTSMTLSPSNHHHNDSQVMRSYRRLAYERRQQCSPYSTNSNQMKGLNDKALLSQINNESRMQQQINEQRSILQSSVLFSNNYNLVSCNQQPQNFVKTKTNIVYHQTTIGGYATPPVSPPMPTSTTEKCQSFSVSPISSVGSTGNISPNRSGSESGESLSRMKSDSWSSIFSASDISKTFSANNTSQSEKLIWRPWGMQL